MKTFPQLWIEELRILENWSLDSKAEVRRITFRRGLNIIWAKASLSDQQELPGFGGHAAGKTSLCRLLRFVLGEDHYGSRFMRDRIVRAFPDGWVVAKVWIGETPWLVARPFRSGLRPKSCRAESIEAMFNDEEVFGRYEEFREASNTAVLEGFPLSEFPSEKEAISLEHLLEWLARDQECRLSGLLDWRHPSSHHDSPFMTAEQRRFLIRATLDFVDDVVRLEIEKRHKLETEAAKIPEDIAFQKRTLRDHLDALRKALPSDDIPDVNESLFVDTVKRLALARRDAELKPLEKALTAVGLPGLRAKQDALNQKLGAKRFQEKELEDHLKDLRTRFQEAQRDGKQEGYDRFWETLKPTDQYCGIPIAVARFRCPLRQEFEPEATPPPITQDLQAMAEAARLQMQRVQERLNPLTEARQNLEADVRGLAQTVSAAEARRDQLNRSRNTVHQAHTLTLFRAEQASATCETIENLEKRQKTLEGEIEDSKQRQESLQKRQIKQIADFSDLFESTLKAFLGSRIEASCRFTREEIDLRADYHGELTSAAIDTLKTIAFDVAALRSGILETSHHPRFLVFDSPREADMHPIPYQRIFHHLKSLETGETTSPFQVIITTTEPPPLSLQESSALVLLLDASTDEGRLYRKDL